MKVQVERFHLNFHITGFRPQTQKLEPPYKTALFTPAVKELIYERSTPPDDGALLLLYFVNLPISQGHRATKLQGLQLNFP